MEEEKKVAGFADAMESSSEMVGVRLMHGARGHSRRKQQSLYMDRNCVLVVGCPC